MPATMQAPQGLLGARGMFNPQLPPGLLAMAAMPGQPAAQMAQNLSAMPAPQPAGQMPPPPRPPAQAPPAASPMPDPGPSQATNNALMAGGMAAMRGAQPGGSLGTALGEGLAAGTSAFVATKNAEKDAKVRRDLQAQYATYVQSLGLDPKATAGLTFMGVEAGSKVLAEAGLRVPEFTTNVVDNGDSKSVVSTNKADGTSRVTYTGAAPTKEPENKPGTDLQSVMSLHYPGKTLAQLTPAERADVDARLEKLSSTRGTKVSVTASPVINAAGNAMGGEVVRDSLAQKSAFMSTVAPELESIGRMRELIRNGGIMTGAFARERATLAAQAGDVKAQNTLMFLKEVTGRVLPVARTLAPVTKEDIVLLEGLKGANLNLTQANIDRLAELDAMAVSARVAEYNTRVTRSAVMSDPSMIGYRRDAYATLPDGSVPVKVGNVVHNAQWDPETNSYWYKTKAGRYVEVK